MKKGVFTLIYEAEEISFIHQDSTVFFAEEEDEPLEIAENTLYCPICEGGVCPGKFG